MYACRCNDLIIDTSTQSSFKPDAASRTPKRARSRCLFNAIQATAVRYVGRNGVRHHVTETQAQAKPVKIVWNFDEGGLLACDGGMFSDKEVFIVYEDRNEHLHAETPKTGQLPMRLKINAAVEQVHS